MSKANSKNHSGWLVKVFFITFFLSIIFNFLSTEVVENLNIVISILILVLVLAIAVATDLIATAATAADEAPFHAKAADKKRGAKQSVMIIKNADKVSSFCADVIGDIAGVLSGATSALIAVNIANLLNQNISITTMLMTAIVTALMVLGKAYGKHIAIVKANEIVNVIGIIISYIPFVKKNK